MISAKFPNGKAFEEFEEVQKTFTVPFCYQVGEEVHGKMKIYTFLVLNRES